jgi:adenylosuccinate synthase
MKTLAVIGANYGDEGKGLITDYLCHSRGAGIVVRFNGGAQAGHTVVVPHGRRHVFSHFGSGTLAGVGTYLSRFFICNPILFCQELQRLGDVNAGVYVDPNALVTTPYDMLLNQAVERRRGPGRHGSCGVGINETLRRSESMPLRVRDLGDSFELRRFLVRQLRDYTPARAAVLGIDASLFSELTSDLFIEPFIQDVTKFRSEVCVMTQQWLRNKSLVFEGAQGLLLDQNNVADSPHLTPSNTGIRNVAEMCGELGIDHVEAYYVSRTYLTRHGAGPLPGELAGPPPGVVDATNVPHPFQGTLRYAPLNTVALIDRVHADADSVSGLNVGMKLAFTCTDQVEPTLRADLVSRGPTRNDVVVA